MLGEYAEAKQHYEESLLISRGNGDRIGMATALTHLGRASIALGEYQQAGSHLKAGLTIAMEIQFIPLIIDGLIGVAMLLAQTGDQPQALTILNLAITHPAIEPQMRVRAEPLLAQLNAASPAEPLAQAEAPETLEAVVAGLLAKGSL